MIAELQCLPTPSGTDDDRHAFVEAAIGVIQASGLTYEVGPLGTSVEGAPDEVWSVLRRAHEAALTAGAERIVSVVKVYEGRGEVDDEVGAPGGESMTMERLTRKFRP